MLLTVQHCTKSFSVIRCIMSTSVKRRRRWTRIQFHSDKTTLSPIFRCTFVTVSSPTRKSFSSEIIHLHSFVVCTNMETRHKTRTNQAQETRLFTTQFTHTLEWQCRMLISVVQGELGDKCVLCTGKLVLQSLCCLRIVPSVLQACQGGKCTSVCLCLCVCVCVCMRDSQRYSTMFNSPGQWGTTSTSIAMYMLRGST